MTGEQRASVQVSVPDRQRDMVPSRRWVRVMFGGRFVGDSKRPILARESGHWLREYYFPPEDVDMDLLVPSEHTADSPTFGRTNYWHVKVGDRVAKNAARSHPDPPPGARQMKDYVAFEWNAMDAWFEEDDQVYRHARDPFKRVDVLNSSRHVQIVLNGVIVVDTHRPRLLFETYTSRRYYVPMEDARMEFFIPSDTHTQCPYKGVASYYSLQVGDKFYKDIAWYYPFPIPECRKIENLIAFYKEEVDAIIVDGESE